MPPISGGLEKHNDRTGRGGEEEYGMLRQHFLQAHRKGRAMGKSERGRWREVKRGRTKRAGSHL